MEENSLAQYDEQAWGINAELRKRLSKRTPKVMVKKNPATGFDYVEVGYVRRRLDECFGLLWSETAEMIVPWEIVAQFNQLSVKVRLEIRDPRSNLVVIVRENYGGSEIKRYGEKHNRAGQPMDLSNDLKAATAEGLKKCASMLGICADIYEPKVEAALAPKTEESVIGAGEVIHLQQAIKRYGIPVEEGKAFLKEKFGKDAAAQLNVKELGEVLDWIHKHPSAIKMREAAAK